MTDLRKAARGRNCEIRIPGICVSGGDNETTVLCHLPGGGMGAKSHNLFGALGCHACHDVVDRRVHTGLTPETIDNWFYEGVFRTQQVWLDEGYIKIV